MPAAGFYCAKPKAEIGQIGSVTVTWEGATSAIRCQQELELELKGRSGNFALLHFQQELVSFSESAGTGNSIGNSNRSGYQLINLVNVRVYWNGRVAADLARLSVSR
jgi:hypothetical protein